jgi:tight adherence protein B
VKSLHALIFWTGVTALALAMGMPAAAHGAELKRLDTSAYPELAVTYVGPRAPTLTENGRPVAGLEVENLGEAKSVVLAVDRSQSMEGEALDRAVEAARAFVAAKPVRDRLAVVAFGSEAVLLSRFASATIDADIALRTLGIDGRQGTALHDAVVLAARELERERMAGRVLVLLTDGADMSSSADGEAALAAARRAGVAVYAIGIEGPQFSPAPLQELARATGGAYHGAAGPAAVTQAYTAVAADLRRTWRLRWMTAARPGDRLELRANSLSLTARLPGRVAPGPEPSTLVPEDAYRSPFGAAAIGLAAGLLLLLAFVLAGAAKRGSWVQRRLAPHVGHRRSAAGAPRERFAAGSALVEATERALGELHFWRKTHRLLDRADVPLRTAEFMYVAMGSGFALGLVVAVSGRSSAVILLALVAGAAAPFAVVWSRAKRRLKAFDNQLPDLLLTIAASLKAGHSFKQGLQTVVDEGLPPAREEFKHVLAEVRLGRPMEAALREMSERVGSKNLEFVISAVTIQGQVGGSLAGLFDMVAEAVRQRQQFARKIRGLTAMGRASAYVLVGLPFLIAFAITVINREYMDPLYNSSTGHTLIAVGLVMIAFGSLILKKIVSFKG